MLRTAIGAGLLFLQTAGFADPSYLQQYTRNPEEWVRPEERPHPAFNLPTPEKISLGKKLFFDPILSRDKTLSCASCHDPAKGWSDGISIAIGDAGARGQRNTPTILNSAYQHVYFFDGRAENLEEQALGPIAAEVEMNLNPEKAVARLKNSPEYIAMFTAAFPKEGITVATLVKAIAVFERTIISKNSRFDRWVAGDPEAISVDEAEGFSIFQDKGNCTICHQGFNFTDQSFNNIGLGDKDVGRYKVKKREIWRGAFKTPTLRDIANSAPYFHDGSVRTLTDAVSICAQGGRKPYDKNKTNLLVDKKLSQKQIEKIVLFLGTLSEAAPGL